MIHLLRDLMEKVGNMKEQMGSVSREMGMLIKNQKETLEIENSVTETNDILDEQISRLGTVEERTASLENVSRNFPT